MKWDKVCPTYTAFHILDFQSAICGLFSLQPKGLQRQDSLMCKPYQSYPFYRFSLYNDINALKNICQAFETKVHFLL